VPFQSGEHLPCCCIESTEYKDEGDRGRAGRLCVLLAVDGTADCPRYETTDEHAGERGQHHRTTAEVIDLVRAPEGKSHIPHGQATIDDRLSARVCDTNTAENNGKVVSDQGRTSSLRQYGTSNNDPGTMTIALSTE
jgi:hypothetical protein